MESFNDLGILQASVTELKIADIDTDDTDDHEYLSKIHRVLANVRTCLHQLTQISSPKLDGKIISPYFRSEIIKKFIIFHE